MTDERIIQHKRRAISTKTGHWAALAATRMWLKVKDIMNDQVVTIEPQATLGAAARRMAERGISCIVVVAEDGAVKGILTDKDFLRQIAEAQGTLYQRTVAEAMSNRVECISPDQTIVEASRIMEAGSIRHLPVVDNGRLMGIVTQTDLTRALNSCKALKDIGEIMSKDVASVPMDTTVAVAVAVMAARRISSVVVVGPGGPQGILTERDVIKKVTGLERDPASVPVTEVMTSPLISVASGYSVFCASRMMDQMHIHRLVVMDDDRLAGILTQTDVFRAVQRWLQSEEEKALELLDSSKTSAYMLDTEGWTIYLNPAFLDLLEVDDPDLLIDKPFMPDQFWVDSQARISFMARLLQGDVRIEEMRLKTAKGNPLYVSVVSTFLRDIHGQVSGIHGAFHDVTAKKLAEEASALAYERLEKINRELKQVQSQIVQSEKLATIGQLAAGVAHELNTPVGFVAGNFEALQKYVLCLRRFVAQYDELAALVAPMEQADVQIKLSQIQGIRQSMKIDFILEDIQSLFDESREGIERVTTIVRNLRDFSRSDAGDKWDDYNLNAGVEATLIVARNEIKYDAEVVKDLGEIPSIPCHAGQINQVLLNILANAAQAIRSQVRPDKEKGTITVRTYATDEHVVCQIADNGPGIAPENMKKMFQPFFTTKPTGKGTGLGMSVSHDIVANKHRGQLLVDSEPGQGTTFTIKLPKIRQPAPKPESLLVEAQSNG